MHAQNYKNMMKCMRQSSFHGSTEHSTPTPQNMSLRNESYATAITLGNMLSRSHNFSDAVGGENQSRYNATQ